MNKIMDTSMKIVILEANALGKDIDLSVFDKLGHVTKFGQTDWEDQVIDRVADADIIIDNKVPMNAHTLQKAAHLKMIAVTATGTNMIDREYMKERGIAVANVGGYSTDSVTQHTFALALFLTQQLAYYDKYVKDGEYVKSDIFTHFGTPIHELKGMTWGIIGLGDIGKSVAQAAEVFGCRVIYYSTSGKNKNPDYEQADWQTLLKESDIISIHAPLNDKTEGMMNLEAFKQMKKTAILINVGRGPIVNEQDLVTALNEGMIAGAGLDVISVEPMRADNPLLQIKDSRKLIVTPHVAWATREARQRLVDEVYLNVKAFLEGEKRNLI